MKIKGTFYILLLLIVLENLCLYYLYRQGVWSTGKNAICLFLASVGFGLVFLYRFYNSTITEPAREKKAVWPTVTGIILLITGLVIMGSDYNALFMERKISPYNSDIIPLIQVACRRLLAGEYPYKMVPDFGWDENMTYLPLHWGPFCFAQLLNVDPRWIPYVLWGIAAVVLSIRGAKVASPILRAAIPLILLASNAVLFYNNNGIVSDSVELMMAGYYMMLMVSFNTTNGWMQGIAIGCCLLSRYSLLLWLPVFAVALWVNGQRRQLFIAAGVAAALVLLLYVLPFMTRDPNIFTDAYKYYTNAATYEWQRVNNNGQPVHLFCGTGFAYWFFTRFAHLPIAERLQLLQRTHVITCLAVTAILAMWYVRNKNKIDNRIFLMGSFKIYLAFFLFLIQVPYEYLMCVGNFISIALFCEQARYVVVPKRIE